MSKQRKPIKSEPKVERIPQSSQQASIIASSFQGPLPPPAILEDYDRVQPGLAAEIVAWARTETEHRHTMEKKAISIDERLAKSYVREVLLGQVFGFAIAIAFLAGALYLAVHGFQIAASALGTLGIGGIVAAFVAGRKQPPSPEDGAGAGPEKPKAKK